MKIAYLLEWEFDKIDGVILKVLNQVDIWKSLGHNVEIFALSKTKNIIQLDGVKNYNKCMKSLLYSKKLNEDLDIFNPDVIYFRFSNYKPYMSKIFNKYPAILELNTNDYNEYTKRKYRSIRDMVSYYLFVATFEKLLKKVKGVISVTDEITEVIKLPNIKLPYKVIPNSINLDNYKSKKLANNTIPNLVFIGTPNQNWHGIDKILDLAKKSKDKLKFHIIGESGYENIDIPNVKFYGYLNKDEYIKILINSDIGIGTLALHRKDMNEACPLKVREYLALGLPIIIGYKDTALLDKEEDWLLKLENSENNVENNLEDIIEFCYKNLNRVVSKSEAKDYVDSKELESSRLEFLLRIKSENF